MYQLMLFFSLTLIFDNLIIICLMKNSLNSICLRNFEILVSGYSYCFLTLGKFPGIISLNKLCVSYLRFT